MANGTVGQQKSLTIQEFRAKFVAGLLHEFIAMAATFENTWFDAARSIGDFALGDLPEPRLGVREHRRGRNQAQGEEHPGRQHILAGAGEADLPRLFVVEQRRGGGGGADQVVPQQRRPEFAVDHLGRLTAHVVQGQSLLDRPDIQFSLPIIIPPKITLFSS